MSQIGSSILCLNGGSSRIKFALYRGSDLAERTLRDRLERIGLSRTNLSYHDLAGAPQATKPPKWIGAFAAVLGGLDTFVFTGGIGENSSPIRERIRENLGFLGLELDRKANLTQASLISSTSSRVAVRVIDTDEEQMIAQLVNRTLSAD